MTLKSCLCITDVPRLKGFLKELDNTAEYLKLYGVEVGFVSIALYPNYGW